MSSVILAIILVGDIRLYLDLNIPRGGEIKKAGDIAQAITINLLRIWSLREGAKSVLVSRFKTWGANPDASEIIHKANPELCKQICHEANCPLQTQTQFALKSVISY